MNNCRYICCDFKRSLVIIKSDEPFDNCNIKRVLGINKL